MLVARVCILLESGSWQPNKLSPLETSFVRLWVVLEDMAVCVECGAQIASTIKVNKGDVQLTICVCVGGGAVFICIIFFSGNSYC